MNMKKLAALLAMLLLLHMSGVGWASAPKSSITATEDIVIQAGETLSITAPTHMDLGTHSIIIEPGGSINVHPGGWLNLTATGEKPAIQSAGSLALDKISITTLGTAIECDGELSLFLCRVEGTMAAASITLDTCVAAPEPARPISFVERKISKITARTGVISIDLGEDISPLWGRRDGIVTLSAPGQDDIREIFTFTIPKQQVDTGTAGTYKLTVELAEPYAGFDLIDVQEPGVYWIEIVDPRIPYFDAVYSLGGGTTIEFDYFYGEPDTLTLWRSYDGGESWTIINPSQYEFGSNYISIPVEPEEWAEPFLLVFEVEGLGYSELLYFEATESGGLGGDRNGGDRMGSGMKLPSKDAENDGGAGAVFPPPPVVTPSPTPKPYPTYSPESDWEPAPTPASTPSPLPSPTPTPPPVLPTQTPTSTSAPTPSPVPSATTMPTSTPVPSFETTPLPQPEATESPTPVPTPVKIPASSPEISAAPMPPSDSAEPPIPTHTPEPSVTLVPAQSVPPDITPSQSVANNDGGSTPPPEPEETPDNPTVLLVVILVTGIGIGTGFALIVGRRVVRPPK